MPATTVAPSVFPIPPYLLLKLPTLSPSAAKLYLLLAAVASPTGQVTNPTAHLCKTSGISRSQLFRSLAQLQSVGLLLRLPRLNRTSPLHLLLLSPQVVVSSMALRPSHSVVPSMTPHSSFHSPLTPAPASTSAPDPASLVMPPMTQQQTLTYISQVTQQLKQFLTDPIPHARSPIPANPPNAL